MSVNPLRAFANVVSFGLGALAGGHLPVGYWPAGAADDGGESVEKASRIVRGRRLEVGERDAEWTDCDGDLWRYNHDENRWENKISRADMVTTWYAATPHAENAPYVEIPQSSSAAEVAPCLEPRAEDSPALESGSGSGASEHPAGAGRPASEGDGRSAEGSDPADQPTRECRGHSHLAEVPAGPEIRAHSPAGHPILTCDDYMDAARACREKGEGIEHPNFAAHWHDLAERFEIAAISAARTRIPVK